jgi:uncharacterized membrane protein YraQ (UPF0718 family)
MAFLITSPIVNEIALVLLGSLLGWKFMVLYAGVGIIAGVLGGLFIDLIKADILLHEEAEDYEICARLKNILEDIDE